MIKVCLNYAGLDVLTAMLVKIKLFWHVTPHWLVNCYVRLEEPTSSI
jgi:hypothetical protein